MKTKLISLILITVFSFTLSACTLKDRLKAKILNKIDTKVQQEKSEATPSPTDDQLLKEIDASSSSSVDIDKQFTDLETEIK